MSAGRRIYALQRVSQLIVTYIVARRESPISSMLKAADRCEEGPGFDLTIY